MLRKPIDLHLSCNGMDAEISFSVLNQLVQGLKQCMEPLLQVSYIIINQLLIDLHPFNDVLNILGSIVIKMFGMSNVTKTLGFQMVLVGMMTMSIRFSLVGRPGAFGPSLRIVIVCPSLKWTF